jgi:hypothetical protein
VELFFVIVSFLYTVILSLNYIVGVIQPHEGYIFLGTVHHPRDYFYYLSQFTQGESRWLTTVDLYTHELIQPSLVGWSNVLAGRLLSFIGVSPIVAYQVTLTLFTFIFLLLVAKFLTILFPAVTQKSTRYIAFILFCVTNTFANAPSFFANVLEPMTRLPRVPHQVLALICIILTIIIVTRIQSKIPLLNYKIAHYLFLVFSAVILASINPAQWFLVVMVLFIALLWHARSIGSVRTPLLFFLAGLPVIVYLHTLFKTPPFSQIALWEGIQQVQFHLATLIQSLGPVTLIALIGLPLFMKHMTLPAKLIITYLLASLLLFFSPVTQLAHITHVRFLSAITVVGLAAVAGNFLTHIPITKVGIRLTVAWVITGFLSLYLTPVWVAQFKTQANLALNNSYVYLPVEVHSAFIETKKRTTAQDIVLVTWPYDRSFPAITGRRGFMGHELLTINTDEKTAGAYNFFDARVSEDAMHQFLLKNNITYVLAFTSTTKIQKPFIQMVYQNSTMTLYKVLP